MIISDNKIVKKYGEKEGIFVYTPYVETKNIFIRRLPYLFDKFHISFFKKILINKKIVKNNDDVVIVFDSQMTSQYLKWLLKKFPNKKLIFWYWNPIRKSIPLKSIPNEFEIWTYSKKEAEKEGIKFHEQFFFGKAEETYLNDGSVVFVGKNKGRLEQIRELEIFLATNGIKTNFIYVKDKRKLINNKKNILINKPISYELVQDLCKKSNIILDYCLNPLDGLSLRPLEAVKFNKKLITNNINIIDTEFYNKNNIFVIGKDSNDKLIDFCQNNLKISYMCNRKKYSFINWYKDLSGK